MKKLTLKNFHPINIVIASCMLAILIMLCVSCKAQPQKQPQPTDLETGLFCELPDSNYYSFEQYFIEDFIYDPITESYVIEYSDECIDDYDSFVQVNCTKDIFFDVITSYNNNCDYEYTEKYNIKEVFTPVEGGINISYFLVLKE